MREVVRGADRFHTVGDGVETWHSFSYGAHYDPDRIGFGPVMAINVEHLAPGAGYAAHRHADVEIVTWVVAGRLRHADSTGAGGVVPPGVAQRLSAGPGVEHTESNASATDPLAFVQLMLVSTWDGPHEYAQQQATLTPGGLAPTVAVHAAARVLVATPAPGRPVRVPAAPRRLVHVVRGTIDVDGTALDVGDELRTDEPGTLVLTAREPAEALVLLLDVAPTFPRV